jgi:hypothetical protein
MSEKKQSEKCRCNEYNNNSKQCIENKCWYYFQQKKCGVNYMNYKNKKTADKRINQIQKKSKKISKLKKSRKKLRRSKKKSKKNISSKRRSKK